MKQLISETATILNLDRVVVETVINSFLRVFVKTITKVRLKELSTLDGIKTNATIPGFGKLVIVPSKKEKFKKRKYVSKKSV